MPIDRALGGLLAVVMGLAACKQPPVSNGTAKAALPPRLVERVFEELGFTAMVPESFGVEAAPDAALFHQPEGSITVRRFPLPPPRGERPPETTGQGILKVHELGGMLVACFVEDASGKTPAAEALCQSIQALPALGKIDRISCKSKIGDVDATADQLRGREDALSHCFSAAHRFSPGTTRGSVTATMILTAEGIPYKIGFGADVDSREAYVPLRGCAVPVFQNLRVPLLTAETGVEDGEMSCDVSWVL